MTTAALLDILLALLIVGLALKVLTARDHFTAVVLFITFGLLTALAFVRLRAPDVALAEAAIGAGLTGALLLDAIGRLTRGRQGHPSVQAASVAPRRGRRAVWPVAIVAAAGLALVAAARYLGAPGPGLAADVAEAIAAADLPPNPVTAVLLVLRGYDTWLELGVLFLAVLGVLALGRMAGDSLPTLPDTAGDTRARDPVLTTLAAVVASVSALAAVHLLLLGTRAPGGAFQAGAAAAAGFVLVRLAGMDTVGRIPGYAFRLAIALGFALPIPLTVMMMTGGAPFLAYPAKAVIAWVLVVETAIMVAVAISLAALFVVAGSIRAATTPPEGTKGG